MPRRSIASSCASKVATRCFSGGRRKRLPRWKPRESGTRSSRVLPPRWLPQRESVRSVTFVTPRVGDDEGAGGWAASLAAADSGAIYMGARQADAIAAALMESGTPGSMPIAVVESASLPNARTIFTTLAALPRLADQALSGPALILIGPQFHPRAERAADVETDRHPLVLREAMG